MERLGLGPEDLCGRNSRLVYGRITGWGQTGPLARSAGHDITYLALTGALAAMGKVGEPAAVPLNLVGDFGGGSMLLVFGVLPALWERERSGRGQIIDAAIVDGVASLMSMFTGLIPSGRISLARDRNVLGGAAPFYRCYLCRDGREVAVGPIEPQYFIQMLNTLGLEELESAQYDETRWNELTGRLATAFAAQDMAHWATIFEGSDACVAPVLTAAEAPSHAHNVARESYVEHNSLLQVAPTPRLSRTAGSIRDPEIRTR